LNNPDDDRIVYPACYYDHWTISVGASGVQGKTTGGSLIGFNMDVLGPETDDTPSGTWAVYTTDLDIGQYNPYDNFGGTSSGTPHISGIGGLMLSYYNETFESPENLFPSDVESLLEISAKNYDTPEIYSETQGWGLVKATSALELLEEPNYKLQHFEENFTSNDLQLLQENELVQIPVVSGDNFNISEGTYTVNKYQIEETVTFPIPNNYIPQNCWANPEVTNCYPDTHIEGNDQYLFLDEYAFVSDQSNISSGQITLKTYVYHILSDDEGALVDVWFPSTQAYTIPYSIHFIDNSPSDIKENSLPELTVFPNPANDYLTIQIEGHSDLSEYTILSVTGATVLQGQTSSIIDVRTLSPGLYVLRLLAKNSYYTHKILKK
jgi:hypothetical protein